MKHRFPIYLTKTHVFSNSQKAITMQNSRKIGELRDGKVFYSNFEALYLLELEKAEILNNNKEMKKEKLIDFFSKKDPYFFTKYIVFKELAKKGYIVKTGLKFGGDFRVYEKSSLNTIHAKWICIPIKGNKINLKELISATRITHSTGKKLLLGIVDSEDNILFYEIDWLKL